MKPFTLQGKRLKSPHMDVFYTEALFIDRCKLHDSLPDNCLFTTSDEHDVESGCYSFKKLYVEIGDPTEYQQAIQMLGSTAHWDVLMKCKWMKPIMKEARAELKRKIKSDAYARIARAADESESDAVRMTAQKFLIKEGCKLMDDNDDEVKSKSHSRGRPSNEEVEGELRRLTAEEKQLMEDMKRVSPSNVN